MAVGTSSSDHSRSPSGLPECRIKMRSARRGARMFGIEVKPAWPSKMQSCSGSLKVGYDFQGGEPLWLALKLYAETRVPLPADNLRVESLVSELLRAVACRLEPSQISPLWLRRVQEKLHAEFYARITIDELALETGVHPVHLSRVAAVWGRELEITSTGSVCGKPANACLPPKFRWQMSVLNSDSPTRATSAALFTRS